MTDPERAVEEFHRELDGIKEMLRRENELLLGRIKDLMNANDQRYEQRFTDNQTAVNAALNAAEKAVAAALSAAEKANEKVEAALKEYKLGANEWRSTVEGLVNDMPTRIEMDRAVHVLEEKLNEYRESIRLEIRGLSGLVAELRESRSQTAGVAQATEAGVGERRTDKAQALLHSRWIIGLVITIVLAVVGYMLGKSGAP